MVEVAGDFLPSLDEEATDLGFILLHWQRPVFKGEERFKHGKGIGAHVGDRISSLQHRCHHQLFLRLVSKRRSQPWIPAHEFLVMVGWVLSIAKVFGC